MTKDDLDNALNELLLRGLVELDDRGNFEITELGKTTFAQELLQHISKRFH